MTFALPSGIRLVEQLGAGSVFEVAVVDREGARCLCKRLRASVRGEAEGRAAMRREIAVLEGAKLACVPALVDHGEDEAGPYVLEAYVEAMTLRELCEAWQERGQLPPARFIDSLLGAGLAALAALHAAEHDGHALALVHGDLGPDHVLLARDGRAWFCDFGLARWHGMAPALLAPRERGTLPFVAPEVASGQAAPDQAGDVFALGAAVAFVVLGHDPCLAAEAAARLAEVAERGLDLAALMRAPNLSSSGRQVLCRLLAFDRKSRLAEARAALEALGLPPR